MNGVVIINKPQGFTSFDVVAVVRKVASTKKCGHCGTLDPNATGVLPVLIGNATKAQDIIPNHDKSYVAEFKLGIETDTLDVWGKTVCTQESCVTTDKLEGALGDFTGDIMQTPPMYSAVSKNGKRLYELARLGVQVERQARPVSVYELRLVSFDESLQSGVLSVSCSKGTYVRQLISDIAQSLGTCGIMTSLVRTSACGFDISDAMSPDEFKKLCESNNPKDCLRSVDSLFDCYKAIKVSDAQAIRFSNGNPLDIARTEFKDLPILNGMILRVYNRVGDFLALGVTDKDTSTIKMYKNFSNK